MLQYVIIFGFYVVGFVLSIMTALILSKPGTPFATLFEVFTYLAGAPESFAAAKPAALASDATLLFAVKQGLFSWQGFVIALIIAISLFLVLMASAYTKALSLGIIAEIIDGKKTAFMDMFRSARQYWLGALKYYLAMGTIVYLLILVAIPLWIMRAAYPVLHGDVQFPITSAGVAFFCILIVLFLFRVCTVFADGAIISGSRKPLKDSFRMLLNHFGYTLSTAGFLLVVAVVVFLLNLALAFAAVTTWLYVVLNVVSLLLIALWRLFVSGFVVARWHGKNPVPSGSRPSSR